MAGYRDAGESGAGPEGLRAAQYLRMSTDHQKYSIQFQKAKIDSFAEENNYRVVSTYIDAGRSGLTFEGRSGLKTLIDDVLHGRAAFEVLLVYDISRWGRFQDIEAGIYYEYLCKKNGIKVIYCAENFPEDNSPLGSISKMLKRIMAAEFSRELSAKTFAGSCHYASRGFHQGGPPGLGLRRMMVDVDRRQKGQLSEGEHKNIHTDHVVLVPGPKREITLVRRIFHMFANESLTETDIANKLNREGITTINGMKWSATTVVSTLRNQRYVGNITYNKTSGKLKTQRTKNPEAQWVGMRGAFPSIIDEETFSKVIVKFSARSGRRDDDVTLHQLRNLYEREGRLSAKLIDASGEMPSSSYYAHRFGRLTNAYEKVGFKVRRDLSRFDLQKDRKHIRPKICNEIWEGLNDRNIASTKTPFKLLSIGADFLIAINISICRISARGVNYWCIYRRRDERAALAIIARLDVDNSTIIDYLFIENKYISKTIITLALDFPETEGITRSKKLSDVYDLCGRMALASS